MEVTIRYERPGKETSFYVQELLGDDGRRLSTYRVFAPERAAELTATLRRHRMIAPGQAVQAIRSHFFYGEYFDIIEWLEPSGRVAGYYSDIATPLRKVDGGYAIIDLFLDVWLAPGHPALGLDEDEFEAAISAGLVPADWQAEARRAYERLLAEAASGAYPRDYLR